MRRRVRGSMPSQFELNLTPLLDVILQLITFFMMLVHFGSQMEGQTDAVRLPIAPAALPGGDTRLDRLAVAVDRSGRLLTEKQTVEPPQIAAWWADQAKNRRDGMRLLGEKPGTELATLVVIRADRDASYGQVRTLLAQAQTAGFARFSLVVLREDRP